MLKNKTIKWLIRLLTALIILITFTGCDVASSINKNPLSGKNTDERIIMCLEDTYPEHQFHVVESFDKQKNEGVFADENGLEFKVTNVVTYQTRYHFGCKDQYLYEILNQQNYIEKVHEILEKYDLLLDAGMDLTFDTADVIHMDVEYYDNMEMLELAEIVKEVLNCVEIPKVCYPEKTSFSTGELNYYSIPEWGFFGCEFESIVPRFSGSMEKFYFWEKAETVENLSKKIEEFIVETKELDELYASWESQEANIQE